MRVSGTTRAILRRPLSRKQWATIEMLPEHLRLGALWRTLKFNDPWPRHRAHKNNDKNIFE
jgi:hypothetical protein